MIETYQNFYAFKKELLELLKRHKVITDEITDMTDFTCQIVDEGEEIIENYQQDFGGFNMLMHRSIGHIPRYMLIMKIPVFYKSQDKEKEND